METVRLVLVTLLLVITFFIYQAWRAQHAQPAPVPVAEQSTVPTPAPEQAAPGTTPTAESAPTTPKVAAVRIGRTIDVQTDVLTVRINTAGGDISHLELVNYRASASDRAPPYTMLDTAPPRLFYPQSGLLAEDGVSAPTHEASFESTADRYRLEAGQDRIDVPLTWQDAGAGVLVRKVYTFHRGAYDVELRYEVRNDGNQPWQARPYAQLLRRKGADAEHKLFMPASFQGAVYYSAADRYHKVGYDDMRQTPLAITLKDGWIGLSEHYFLAAVLLDGEQPAQCYTKALAEERYLAGCISGPLRVEPGQSASWHTRLYAGPKAQDRLEDVAEGLALTVDYGKLTVIAQPVFWLLSTIHGVVGNWGVAIILVTLLIKLAFYRLSAASYRSMAHMRKVQPKIMALRERYKDDRQQLNEKMMELYRTEKINPLGGCLPILVQIPVFIALYWVLLESVELRHAPFMLWIQDLSGADPYYVLPVLMGVSMFLQQRMTPMVGMEPMQRRIMLAMPLVFTVFFALFPAGLVLYWFVNNVLSIAQQWFINRQLERKAAT
ncbi:MAG: membrane protein insertase YidC [Immundisolibacter sp.]